MDVDVTPANLDDLRNTEPVGSVQCMLANGERHSFFFHDFATVAFVHTYSALRAFADEEISRHPASGATLAACAYWFMACESVISLLYRIHLSVDGGSGNARTIEQKFESVDDAFFGAALRTHPARLPLMEFRAFRNDVFHDLSRAPEYHHTRFSQRADRMNMVDVMQSLAVAEGLFCGLRRALFRVDLMPDINLGIGAFCKLDVLCEEVIWPSWHELLLEKGLASGVERIAAESPGPSRRVEAAVIMRTSADDGPKFGPAPIATVELEKRLGIVQHFHAPDDGAFIMPNYFAPVNAGHT